MEKTSDLFKKIEAIKDTFHVRMSTIKVTNGKDLTEAEEIKKRWQEYTELYKKGLNDLDNHNGVVTHLQPGILECEVKWNLGSISLNKGHFSSVAQLCPTFATLWTVQPMHFSRPEYWSEPPFSSPGDLPNPGIETRSPALQVDSSPAEPPGKPLQLMIKKRISPGEKLAKI